MWRRYGRLSAWFAFTGGPLSDELMTASARADTDVKVLWMTPRHHRPGSKKRNDVTTRKRAKPYSDGRWRVLAQ